eukprot:329257-Pelagomonas_calceolata.AAC.1
MSLAYARNSFGRGDCKKAARSQSLIGQLRTFCGHSLGGAGVERTGIWILRMLVGMLTMRGTWLLRDPSSGVWQGLHRWASSEGRTIPSIRLNVYSVQLLSILR